MNKYPKISLGNGVNPNVQIVIPDKSIDANQLTIEWVSADRILIKDQSSSHGTKVNGSFIVSKMITPEDDIVIGHYRFKGSELIHKSKKHFFKDRINFADEFQELKHVYDEYLKRERREKRTYSLMLNLLRVGIFIIIILFLLAVSNVFNLRNDFRIFLIVLAGTISTLFVERLLDSSKHKARLQLIKENYEHEFVCPKCDFPMHNRSYSYWVKKRMCPKCHAIWVQ